PRSTPSSRRSWGSDDRGAINPPKMFLPSRGGLLMAQRQAAIASARNLEPESRGDAVGEPFGIAGTKGAGNPQVPEHRIRQANPPFGPAVDLFDRFGKPNVVERYHCRARISAEGDLRHADGGRPVGYDHPLPRRETGDMPRRAIAGRRIRHVDTAFDQRDHGSLVAEAHEELRAMRHDLGAGGCNDKGTGIAKDREPTLPALELQPPLRAVDVHRQLASRFEHDLRAIGEA